MKHQFNNVIVYAFLLLFPASLLLSCHSGSASADRDGEKISAPAENAALAAKDDPIQNKVPEEIMKRGGQVYRSYCLACHQADGSGNPGMYPPLEQTKKVLGDKKELIEVILHGLSGKIEVKGETYYQTMAPHNFLSDQQIADLLSYVRNSFGNSASIITPGDVKKVRDDGAN